MKHIIVIYSSLPYKELPTSPLFHKAHCHQMTSWHLHVQYSKTLPGVWATSIQVRQLLKRAQNILVTYFCTSFSPER
jgi:hypothetical protein